MALKDGAMAALGCIGMQIPYALSGDPHKAGFVGETLMRCVPISLDTDYDGYSDHWWWDNLAHLLAGYAVGTVLAQLFDSEERVVKVFLLITGGWEVFEYVSNERPWHVDDSGEMYFAFDHAMEDTMLDSVMGAAGAWLAAR